MDILFINTVDFSKTNIAPPLGLFSLAGVLRKETNLEVEVINFDYLNSIGDITYSNIMDENLEMMVSYILKYNAKVVDFYTMCNSYAITLCMAKKLREKDDKLKIIFGGPHATLCAEESLKYFDFIDLVGIGEGELYISDLMTRLVNNQDYTKLKGIAYRTKEGLRITKYPHMLKNEELGNYTVYDYNLDMVKDLTYFPIEAGRGCPFNCTFCSTSMFWGRKFRIKPVKVLIQEMKEFNKRYGIASFSLEHDMFTMNKDYLFKFCNVLIEEKLSFKWACSSRIDALDEECMVMMKKAGCVHIYMGIETGSQELQKIVKKNLKLDRSLETIFLLQKYQFDLTISFIYGFPDETEEHFRDTIGMIQKLLLNGIQSIQLHLFIPLPNTFETTKIADKVYYDNTQIERSVYEANKINSQLEQMFQDYKDVFIQYYTFDSEIRIKYKRADFLVVSFVIVLSIYKYSAMYILQKYSLMNIYDRYHDYIESQYQLLQNISILEDFDSKNRNKYSYKIIDRIILNEIEETSNKSLMELHKFEKKIYKYKYCKEKKPIILFSKYDIIKAMNEGKIIKKNSYITVLRKSNRISLKEVKVTKEVEKKLNNNI